MGKCKTLRGPDAILRQIEKVISDNEEKKKAKEEKTSGKEETIKEKGPEKVVEWTQDEQNMLQKALKQYPASMDAGERWAKISEMVGGNKTKKDCLNRVKEIKAMMKKK